MLHGYSDVVVLANAHLPKTDIQAQLELGPNHGVDRGVVPGYQLIAQVIWSGYGWQRDALRTVYSKPGSIAYESQVSTLFTHPAQGHLRTPGPAGLPPHARPNLASERH